MENTNRYEERKFHNLRIRKQYFEAIGKHCFDHDKSLARAIEDAIERYCEEEGIAIEEVTP